MRRGPLVATLLLAALPSCDERGEPSKASEPSEIVWSLPEADFWKDTRPPLGGGGRIVVTNNLSDTLSILDLDAVGGPTVAELARVPVGLIPVEREGPHHVTADAAGEFYYVGISNYVPGAGSGPHGVHGAGTADGHALKIRVADNLAVGSLRVDRNPGDVRLTPDGKRLLVTHFDLLKIVEALEQHAPPSAMDARLVVIDPRTMTTLARLGVCPAPHGVAIAPDSRTAYLSCLSDELAVVDLEAGEGAAVRRLAVMEAPGDATAPRCSPYAVTISPAGDAVWVSCQVDGAVRRYDVAAAAMDPGGTVALPGAAVFGTFTRDGKTLIVPHQGQDGVAFIDAAERRLVDDVILPRESCIAPHVVRLSDDERFLMMVCEGNHSDPGTFVVLDAATHALLSTTVLGRFPDDIAIVRGRP